jgi:hypothetical protein
MHISLSIVLSWASKVHRSVNLKILVVRALLRVGWLFRVQRRALASHSGHATAIGYAMGRVPPDASTAVLQRGNPSFTTGPNTGYSCTYSRQPGQRAARNLSRFYWRQNSGPN